MLTGLGMAETTPGPLIMVVQYVGFLAGYRTPGTLPPLLTATLAGLLVTWVTFTPCFLWVFLGAPYVEALRGVRALGAALSAVTAAVVGVILNLAVWFGVHVIFRETVAWHGFGLNLSVPVLPSLDIFATVLAIAAALAIFRFKAGVIQTLWPAPSRAWCCSWPSVWCHEADNIGKLALLWRGDPETRRQATPGNNRWHQIFTALGAQNIHAEPAVYCEEAADEVQDQLLTVDGVLVWVDPLSDGRTGSSSTRCCARSHPAASG